LKNKILKVLVEHKDEYVSGEELSRILGITRAGIWKHIENLRLEGYIIESQTRLGHKLIHGPLNPFILSKGLGTESLGCNFVVRQQVDSTNNLAKELAKSGAVNGTVIVAEEQLGGKGRQGRNWVSPKGGIWMSIVLRPQIELKDAACYTLLTGVAAARGLRDATGIQVGIKWPNDLLLNDKKIGGILTEVQGEWQAVDYLVIGIGINVNITAEQLIPGLNATSVLIEKNREIDIVRTIQAILSHLERLEKLLQTKGFSAVLEEWRELAVCLNCGVLVKDQSGEWTADSIDISHDGSLLVRKADGQLTQIYSGDVSLRGREGNYTFT
jgi:BirA family transcriptional regulator, biotin operon repressor / biotin---[acetyl-CoA-carboxylase] ligase